MTDIPASRTLFIIDGYNIIFRAYFAFISNPLRNERGENTSALFGFFRTIAALIREYNPQELCIALDSISPTFRHTRYPQYKATRKKTPDDLKSQFPRIEAILDEMKLPTIRADGYEADDVIASVVRAYAHSEKHCVIVSTDKDLMQLITDRVTMLRPSQGGFEHLDAAGVMQNKGVRPDQIGDYLALVGDSSDNIPGVRGVGGKTAIALLAKYDTLTNIYEQLALLPHSAQRKRLVEDEANAQLSRELVTLVDTIDIEVPAHGYPLSIELGGAAALLKEENIHGLTHEYQQIISGDPAALGAHHSSTAQDAVATYADQYELLTTIEDIQKWMQIIRAHGVCAFDTETTSLDPMQAEPVGLSFAIDNHRACYIPLLGPAGKIIDANAVRECVKPLLEDPEVGIVGQNIKYDITVMANWGVRVRGITHDTMIAAWLLDVTAHSYALDVLAQKYLGYRTVPFPEQAKKEGFASIELSEACVYAAEDADITYALYIRFEAALKKQPTVYKLYQEVEMALTPVLFHMEHTGIKVDVSVLARLSKQLKGEIVHLRNEIHAISGEEFNVNSTKALQEILFVKLGLTPVKKTKTGYSTDTSVLAILAHHHPLPSKILEYRGVSKLLSTYVDALPRLVHPHTGRIHTTYSIVGTNTGRISSANPNMQNIPVKDERGKQIRAAFLPEEHYTFISADYSQIELAVFTHLSQDPELLTAFREGQDVHALTAASILKTDAHDITAEQRRMAKVINFGVMYGMSAFRLAGELHITQAEARLFIQQYFIKYAGVKRYIDETIAQARDTGYVHTLLGRRRAVPDLHSKNGNIRQAAERIAINTPVQGSAADIIKIAMRNLHRTFQENRLKSRMVLQVHDELVIEALDSERDEVIEIIEREMTGAYQLSVPLRVHINSGSNWGVL